MIKRWCGYVVAGFVFLAGLFLSRDKWAEKAISNEEEDVQNDLHQAEVANQQAAKHDQKAHEIKSEAEKTKDKKSTKDLLSRWRK